MISVVIPAHNEAAVIRRGLEHLLAGAQPGELEVIVACNGCTDDTAAIAREFGPPVQVLEIATPSKIAALNAADDRATDFPRFYVDADVELPLESIRQIASAMRRARAPMGTPEVAMDFTGASWTVRAFYRVWTALPYNRDYGAVGTGAYALSQVGRARFDRFPDLIADDGFVRFLFADEERLTVRGAAVNVRAPRNLAALLAIHTRSRLGGYQLTNSQRIPLRRSPFNRLRFVAHYLLQSPIAAIDLAVYAMVNLMCRLRARRQLACISTYRWERDLTTRDG